jgi:hypothetical protein
MGSYIHTDPNTPGLNTVRGEEFGCKIEYVIVASSTQEHALMLKNATASGVRATGVCVRVSMLSSATAVIKVRPFFNPTATGTGTSATAVNFLNGGDASVVTYHVSSTSTSTGVEVPVVLVVSPNSPVVEYKMPFVFGAGQRVLFTAESSVASAIAGIEVRWDEEVIA